MHSEEEARKLWCPMARVAAHFNEGMKNNVAFNRDPDGDPRASTYCIASQCMMWQWLDDEFEYLFSPPEQEGWTHVPYYSEGGTKCDRWGRKHQNRKGFCGLARR